MSRRAPRAALEGGPGGGGGWGGDADAADAAPLPPPRARRGPTTWEAGPLSASYDWRQFPNRLKVIKRVLALPLLDVQAFCWLDPRAALAAANDRHNRPRPPPRLFLASDDSFDSSEGEDVDDGWEQVAGAGAGSSHGHRRRRPRRRPQPAKAGGRGALASSALNPPAAPTSAPSSSSSRPWFGTGVVCRDRLLQGLISVDPATRTLDYSKALPVSLGGGAALVLGASWKIDGSSIVPGQPAWRPALRVGLTTALRGGGPSRRADGDGEGAGDTTRASATIRGSPLGSIHVRQTAFLDRRLGVEVVGDLSARLRAAAATRASAGAAAAAAAAAMGGGDGFEERAGATIPLSPDLFDSVVLHADVSEVNLVWRL
jgi:hypothetical protein